MRYVVTPDFTQKVKLYSDDWQAKKAVSEILDYIDTVSYMEDLNNDLNELVHLEKNIYAFNRNIVRIYFSLEDDDSGSYLLLLDLTVSKKVVAATNPANDPNRNSAINPNRNSAINPNRNSAINPNRNSAINPNRNSAINPNRNSAINPNRNSAINPNRNSAINPNRNSAINPNRNSAINPRRNPGFAGPILYDLSNNMVGYLVRIEDDIMLHYNNDNQYIGYCISNSADGYNIFSTSAVWLGYLVKANERVLLQFSQQGQWLGFAA